MPPRTLTTLAIVISLFAPIQAQQQATVVLLPIGAISESDRWIAAGLSRDLIEKMVRTPELRPVPEMQVKSNLARILTRKSKGPAWLPASAQRKVGEWLDADLVLTGYVGASGNRDQARSFLDNLSIVPSNTPEGSEVWVAARLVDSPDWQNSFVGVCRGKPRRPVRASRRPLPPDDRGLGTRPR